MDIEGRKAICVRTTPAAAAEHACRLQGTTPTTFIEVGPRFRDPRAWGFDIVLRRHVLEGVLRAQGPLSRRPPYLDVVIYIPPDSRYFRP